MDNLDFINDFKELGCISDNVHEKDHIIWENKVFHEYVVNECTRLNSEINRFDNLTGTLEKEIIALESQLEEITQFLPIQEETLKISEESLVVHKTLNEKLNNERNELNKKYTNILDNHYNNLMKYRVQYENNSGNYVELRKEQVALKKSELNLRDLQVKINIAQRIHQQYNDIQKKVYLSKLKKFSTFYIVFNKMENVGKLLETKKREESELLKKCLELEEKVKENDSKLRTFIMSPTILDKRSENENNEFSLELFMEKIDKITMAGSSVFMDKVFTKNKSKVQILDVSVFKADDKKRNVAKTLNNDILREAKTLINKNSEERLTNNDQFQVSQAKTKENNILLHKSLTLSQDNKAVEGANNDETSHDVSSLELGDTSIANSQSQKKTDTKNDEMIQQEVTKPEVTTSKFFNNSKKSVKFIGNNSFSEIVQQEKTIFSFALDKEDTLLNNESIMSPGEEDFSGESRFNLLENSITEKSDFHDVFADFDGTNFMPPFSSNSSEPKEDNQGTDVAFNFSAFKKFNMF